MAPYEGYGFHLVSMFTGGNSPRNSAKRRCARPFWLKQCLSQMAIRGHSMHYAKEGRGKGDGEPPQRCIFWASQPKPVTSTGGPQRYRVGGILKPVKAGGVDEEGRPPNVSGTLHVSVGAVVVGTRDREALCFAARALPHPVATDSLLALR